MAAEYVGRFELVKLLVEWWQSPEIEADQLIAEAEKLEAWIEEGKENAPGNQGVVKIDLGEAKPERDPVGLAYSAGVSPE